MSQKFRLAWMISELQDHTMHLVMLSIQLITSKNILTRGPVSLLYNVLRGICLVESMSSGELMILIETNDYTEMMQLQT